ncbi:hypothetical protein OKJ48_20805 [Streptomyces kunmingensis]|uniref:Uncharacterized protein n=1 Tax=Streptomyces kunmingensis TaxID=68225 RepID=A0ABU6CE67_9ACTN|nr:hypothetical protein [Streptomyces kunmingensis]MEB3962670.1 hypothetical protein [Streptomyces kunmingensis]
MAVELQLGDALDRLAQSYFRDAAVGRGGFEAAVVHEFGQDVDGDCGVRVSVRER